MTVGVGGSTAEAELAAIRNMRGDAPPIGVDERLKRIARALKRGPEAVGYGTSLWTAWRVADLIERECGVRYSTVHAWRILRALGWTPQRPAGRARERDEAAIRAWKRTRWPALKKTPRAKVKPSSSSTKAG